MNIEPFFTRRYKKHSYTCLHFTREVWLELTGVDIGLRLAALLGHTDDRHIERAHFRAFERLPQACAPCIVYMRALSHNPHVGVLLKDGLFHLRESGPECFPFEVATRGYTNFRFYK